MNAREVIEALVSALDRTEANFAAAVAGRPVRDYAETVAENRSALALAMAALDTPAAPTTEAGTYPCCGQCDPGCSGRHENPCRPRCQMSTTAAMYAVADEGAARAKGELA